MPPRPFRVNGFDTDFFGMADFRGGALEHVRGGCVQGVRFGPFPDKPTPKGDILLSNDPKLRPSGLKGIRIFIHYPKAQYLSAHRAACALRANYLLATRHGGLLHDVVAGGVVVNDAFSARLTISRSCSFSKLRR